nr:sulfur carrier protein ThiS [Paenibacillus baekrokdamisoli]
MAETCRSFRTALTGQQGAGGSGETRTIRINGRNEQTNAQSVHALMEQLGFAGKRMVVELNGVIIAREAWHTALLEQGASLELVHFVGGG